MHWGRADRLLASSARSGKQASGSNEDDEHHDTYHAVGENLLPGFGFHCYRVQDGLPLNKVWFAAGGQVPKTRYVSTGP